MLRTVFISFYTIFSTILVGIFIIIVSLFSSSNFLHCVAMYWAKSILLSGNIRVKVKGLENIDISKPYVFMSNHQSMFDIPVILGYLPAQFRWLAKAELFKIPIFGLAMRKAGYISIDRSNRKSAFKSLERAVEIIRNGASVLIFPEGTRSRDGNVGGFKKGGFVLAINSGVPIVPVVVHGAWEIMSKDKISIKKGNLTLEILEPVETKNYTRKNKEELMEKIREIITGSFESGKRNIT